MSAPAAETAKPQSLADTAAGMLRWVRENPAQSFTIAAVLATLAYFFGFLQLFVKGTFDLGLASTASWAWQAWNPSNNQEHSRLVPLIFLGLLFYHRDRLRAAAGPGSNLGLIPILIGVALFVLSARCLQPRLALASLPFLIYGAAVFVWGKAVGRVILFPCAFLIFLIPLAVVEQATFRLQFVITGIVGALSNLAGIKIAAVGTSLTAMDGSFNFEIAEGCSGIRSLMAMTMITAIYVHLTQDALWKKVTIFVFSVVFAIVGNAGRIFTVVIVAKLINPDLAAGIYHDYSGFVFFPIALGVMLGFSKLINMDFRRERIAEQVRKREAVSYDY
jgi:exosortase